jgi:signal peptidase I
MPTAKMPMRTMGQRTTTNVAARWIPVVRIRGRSMLPTLAHGQVLVTRPARGRIAKGDVVVFTAATGRHYVKRIAGMPGDVVTLEAGRLYVNGRAWDGGPRTAGAHVERWRVPDGHCFVVGDNVQESDDSRVWRDPFVSLARIGGVGFRRGPWRRLAADSSRRESQR